MRRNILTLCFILLSILIVSCSDLESRGISELNGVSAKTTKATYSTDEDSIKVKLSNSTDQAYLYGDTYLLEYLNNDKWDVVPLKDDVGFSDVANVLQGNSTNEITYNVRSAYGLLSPGKYRIVIKLSPKNKNKAYTITSNFTIK